MKNGVRYVVTTHWGIFSLDEGSYQDYLNGKHWICWAPGKPARQVPANHRPANITDRAIALREQADRHGILMTIRKLDLREVIVPYSSRLAELSIDEMNLTVRSRNGLRRANIHTFGDLKARLGTEEGLTHIRNIGQKSIKEIKGVFFTECYDRLLPYERAAYWQELLDHPGAFSTCAGSAVMV